jgi:ABC-2 type transport system ATP-binding protein
LGVAKAALSLTDVKVAYGRSVALDGISLRIEPGQVLALLGPNGAGKSTTVDVCCGLRPVDGGRVTVLGLDVAKEVKKVRAAIGVVPQDSGLYSELTPVEHLKLAAAMYGLGKSVANARIEELLRLVDLWDRRNERVSRFSGGMRRRVALARALMHDPMLLFLDEPTLGVDVHGRRALWDHVTGLRARGKSVLLTTNYLDEAKALCDRVAILDHGRIVASATPAELSAKAGGSTVVLGCPGDAAAVRQVEKAVSGRAGVLGTKVEGNELRVTLAREDAAAPVVAAASGAGKVTSVATLSPSLEDVFLSLTGRALRD